MIEKVSKSKVISPTWHAILKSRILTFTLKPSKARFVNVMKEYLGIIAPCIGGLGCKSLQNLSAMLLWINAMASSPRDKRANLNNLLH